MEKNIKINSEKALQSALEKFPPKITGTRKTLFGDKPVDANEGARALYIEGFKAALEEFGEKLIASQKPVDPEIQKVINDYFWEML